MDSKLLRKIDPYRNRVEDFLRNVAIYEEQLEDALVPYYYQNLPIAGHATAAGTARFVERSSDNIAKENFRKPFDSELMLSSLGIGTYMGAPDDMTDFNMYNAIKMSLLSGGINVVDTALNYRYQKSERTVGKALETLVEKYGLKRDEFFVSSKIGYFADDADEGLPGRIVVEDLIKEGKVPREEVIPDLHCLHPEFLEY